MCSRCLNHLDQYRKVKNVYSPIPRTLKAVQVDKNVTFTAPWGTRQNIQKGGYIVEDENAETWGVQRTSFNATYVRMRK